ncbi:MAG TPA: sensor histidine kinase [Anaerolineales bacterium]|nr:sensor histidine kinase [Anaerolineales bacterium]
MMRTLGVYLLYAAVVLRAVVVVSVQPEFPWVLALLASYGLLLFSATWLTHRDLQRYMRSRKLQLSYLSLQSILIIATLVAATYEDFLAMLFIPLSLDAVSFFGRRAGFMSIAIFSLAMTFTLLFSDAGWLFGLVMGILYSGLCFLFGGYAHQVLKAQAAHDQNEHTFNQLQVAHRHLQGYAEQKASLAVEHERNRLARDLHDSVTQTVFSMNLAAQSAQLLLEREPTRAAGQLLRIEELAASALREIQALVSQLKPSSIAEESLPALLRRLAAEKAGEGLHVSLDIRGEETLPQPVTTNLYSIVQEALINVIRHSGVCDATVRLNLEPYQSRLEIEDRGKGFELTAALNRPGHLGVAGMFERAREIGWCLSVVAKPGEGTRICVTKHESGARQ